MRRVILSILRCPKCRRGGLIPAADTAEVIFGPVRCADCQSSFPVAEGVADLVGDRGPVRIVQKGFEHAFVARSYERYVRPALQLVLSRRRIDRDSEYLLYRALLGRPDGPVLDLGCGTGLFARRLAREPDIAAVVGMDVAKPMIEEAVAQSREAGVMVDFVRAEAPYLPFMDHSLGGVLQAASLHLVVDASRLFIEVGRVLRPKGRYVASTYLPPPYFAALLHRKAGLFPRREDELKSAIAAAGLVNFERLVIPPLIVVKAEKAAQT